MDLFLPVEDDVQLTAATPRMIRWVKNSCIYRLNQKMMSERQLFDALVRKAQQKFEGVDLSLARQIAQAGIDFCNDNKFLNDASFAEMKAGSGMRGGKSRRRIAMDLKQKGIEPEIVEASLELVDDLDAAVNFARKRAFGPYRKVEYDEKRKAKEFAAFARNGFASSLTVKILRMTMSEIDEHLSMS